MKTIAAFLIVSLIFSQSIFAVSGTEVIDPRTLKLARRTYQMTVADCFSSVPVGGPPKQVWVCGRSYDIPGAGVAFRIDPENIQKYVFPTTTVRGYITMYATANGPYLSLTSQEPGTGGGSYARLLTDAEFRRAIETAFVVSRLNEVKMVINVLTLR